MFSKFSQLVATHRRSLAMAAVAATSTAVCYTQQYKSLKPTFTQMKAAGLVAPLLFSGSSILA